MSIYVRELPKVFPHVITVPEPRVRSLVSEIMYRRDLRNGSSFAVTTDASSGQWNLWLSDTSHSFLVEEGLIPVG